MEADEVAARRTELLQLLTRRDDGDGDESSKLAMMGKKRKRSRVELRRIEDRTSRQVRFSKRRSGLFKKALQLSVLCDARVALVVFSPAGRLYDFASPGSSIEEIFGQYWDFANTAIDLNIEAREYSRVNCNIQNERRSAAGSVSDLLIMTDQCFRAVEANPNEMDMDEIKGLEEALTDALAIIKNKLTTKVAAGPKPEVHRF